MKTLLKFLGKAILIIVAGILALVLLLWGGANIAKFFIYSEYYSMETNVATNPGLGDGFVCQGVCVSEENGVIMVCGYMDDKTNSRIYVVDIETDKSYHVKLERNGKVYTGHAGGMATSGNTVYIANGSKLYLLNISDILSAEDGDILDIGSGVPVNNAASYVYCDEEYIYVGEFHHTKDDYDKEHILDDGETKVNAIIARYTHADIANYDGENEPTPSKIYSVRAKVQGVCFTPDGKVVLSTSYSIAHSYFYIYNEADARDTGKTLDGVPVYALEDCIKEIKAPAMSEDMDYYCGMPITLYESACNKYKFGKLFFANDIIGLEIN